MRILVLAVGRARAPFAEAAAHYERLLARRARVELVEVDEPAQVARRVPARAFVCVLDERGEQLDSLAFSRFLEERRQAGRDLAFLLGGPFGHELGDLAVDRRLSLGSLTLPHQLARVVLLEQLFRAHKILAGEAYHH